MSISVEIVQGGRTLRQYNHGGRVFVEAPPEGDYSIRLTNRSWGRRLCVLSVDGLNAIDGTDAGFNGPGYVLNGFQSITVKGWRRSDSEVAAFRFNPVGEGYAEKTGRGSANTGRIGVAVFEERVNWTLTWTPDYSQAGTYANVSFTVTDNGSPNLNDSEAITIAVVDSLADLPLEALLKRLGSSPPLADADD